MVRKKWMIVLMLSLYVSQLFSTANSTCIARLLQNGCDSDTNDAVSCCNAISNEIRNDQVCMCNMFNANVTVWTDALAACKIDFDFVTECSARTTTTTPSTTTPSSTSSAGSTSSNTSTINALIGSVITTVGVTMIIVISIYCICKGQRHRNTASYPHAYAEMPKTQTTVLQQNNPSVYGGIPPTAPFSTPMTNVPPAPSGDVDFGADKSMQFDLSTLQAATNNFSEDNLMGRGGFGCVYKGTLSNGSEIAVKRLFKITSQVDQEIKDEIELLAKLQHRNLVRLLGFCLKKPEAILVYELLPNKSLDYFLFDNKKREELNWSIRFEIIRGVAKGLMYLHEDSLVKTIHRDLKPHNILLDANMNAKIADFGLAKICAPDQTHVQATHVAGTDGYISPEYRYHRQISEKSDVYAFGIILMEIISGRKINCGFENQPGEPSESLMSYAWRCWADKKPLTFVDPLMSRDSFSSDEVIKCIHLGLLCNQDDPRKRPNMSTIVHKLNSNPDIATLSTPQIPVFLFSSTSDQSTTTLTMQRSSDLSTCPASSSVDSNSKLSH